MRWIYSRLTWLSLAFMLVRIGAEADSPARPEYAEDPEATVITSESLVYEGENMVAVFKNEVRVIDPRIRLSADKMTVRFGEDNSIIHIEAEGDVYIVQEDRQSWSQMAAYDVPTGEIVLDGDPLIRRGMDMLQGDRITFWRDESRIVCEPHARLTVVPDEVPLGGPLQRNERE